MKSLETYVDPQLDLQYIINFYKVCIEKLMWDVNLLIQILSKNHVHILNNCCPNFMKFDFIESLIQTEGVVVLAPYLTTHHHICTY